MTGGAVLLSASVPKVGESVTILWLLNINIVISTALESVMGQSSLARFKNLKVRKRQTPSAPSAIRSKSHVPFSKNVCDPLEVI